MKKLICLFSFFGVFSISLFAAKVTYNQTPLTNGTATVWLTCSRNESCQYIVTIEGENLRGLGGTYFNPGTVPLNTTITTNTSTKIVCTITAESSPKFYTPLYVLMPGEVPFNEIQDKDIDWGSGGSCDLPRMISASVKSVEGTTASVLVNATDAVTPFADLRYNYTLTQGEDVWQQANVSASNGILPLTGLLPGKTYTLEIRAVDGDNNVSANSVSVTFTTENSFVDLYIISDRNGWSTSVPGYQFRKTAVAGIYSLTLSLPRGTFLYKLSTSTPESCTPQDHFLVLSTDKEVTFYAKNVNNFASSADSLFLVGAAVSDACTEPTQCTPNKNSLCEWYGTQAIWQGAVSLNKTYRLAKCATPSYKAVYYSDIMSTNETLSEISASKGAFVFDLPTLSWSWQNIEEGQCNFFGSEGDGQTSNGSNLFTKGYTLTLYLNPEKTSIHVTAEFLDDDKEPTKAYFQNYPQREEGKERNEFLLAQRQGTKIFDGDIPVSELKNKADGIIRFGIKFEFDGGLRVTTPEFYYLDGSGCAERDFVIYHHGQKPENPERDAVYTFEGGRILQPIVYKRKLKPGIWETLSLPFDVSKITVSDKEGEYELHAQYTDNNTTHEGEFWLRDFREKEVSAEDFQANWHDIQATTAETALPKKNVPYIIRVPDDNTHYWEGKYIVFHGASYQTIDDVYSTDVQTPRATEMFAYSGNNTMKQWQLRSAYVLDNEGIYFESGETVKLYPFECAVNAEIETTRAMPRLALNRKPATPTGNLPPTTAVEPGNVWSVTGWYVGSFCDSNQYDRLMQRLPAGMYVVRQAETTYKVYIAR